MKRAILQVFVKGSNEALKFYQKAFDAKLKCAYPNPDGTLAHSEIDVYGQSMMIGELTEENAVPGNTMMFCLHFEKGEEAVIHRIYGILKENAKIVSPLGPSSYSPLEADLFDRFGVRWCIFI